MMYHLRRAGFAAPVLLLGVALAPASAQSGKGLTMTLTMTSTSPTEPKPTVVMMQKVQFASSGLARGDVLPTGDKPDAPATGDKAPILQPGTYSLSKKGSDTTYIVDPSRKKYWMSVLTKGVSPGSMKYSNFDVQSQRVMPDSSIEGIAVQHWHLTDKSTTKYTSNQSTIDVYTAPGFDAGLAQQFTKSSLMVGTGDAAYDAKRTAAYSQAMQGLPLLMKMQMQILVYNGKPVSMNMTMRCSNISKGDPPASIFVLPSGYTLVQSSK